MGRVPEATPTDVDKAVQAAKAALDGWATTSAEERSKYLQRIAEGLQARTMDIANVVAQELGMPINLSMIIQAGLPTVTFSSMPQVIDEINFEEQIGNSLVVKEPIGVVGAITPWNYPLHQIANTIHALTAPATMNPQVPRLFRVVMSMALAMMIAARTRPEKMRLATF